MPDRVKLAQRLLAEYISVFKLKYNRLPVVNKYKDKWGFVDVIDTVGYDRAKELLEYYFSLTRDGHPLTWFFYNFDSLDTAEKELQKDRENRKQLLEFTKRKMNGN